MRVTKIAENKIPSLNPVSGRYGTAVITTASTLTVGGGSGGIKTTVVSGIEILGSS
jgi:hypothetical protein